MLDERWSRDFPRFAMFEGRQEVHLSHDITVRLKATGRAAVNAPPGFVSIAAIGASLAGVVFVYQNDGDAYGLSLVFNQLADFAMTPAANLLVGFLAKCHTIGNILDIPDNDGAGFAFDCHIDNGTANLAFDVVDLTLML